MRSDPLADDASFCAMMRELSSLDGKGTPNLTLTLTLTLALRITLTLTLTLTLTMTLTLTLTQARARLPSRAPPASPRGYRPL